MKLEAYLFFPRNAGEAMAFYHSIFGGELTITRRGEVDPTADDEYKALIINAELRAEAFTLRAADRTNTSNEVQTRIELTVLGTEDAELRRVFDALSQGGEVKQPIEKMFWGDHFGALIDRYGIGWQINITQ